MCPKARALSRAILMDRAWTFDALFARPSLPSMAKDQAMVRVRGHWLLKRMPASDTPRQAPSCSPHGLRDRLPGSAILNLVEKALW